MTRVLDPTMTLHREGDGIVLYRRTWSGSFPKFPVHPVVAVILALLDGARREEEVATTLAEAFSFTPESAARTVSLVTRKYERFLVPRDKLNGTPPVVYDPVDFIVPARPPQGYPREIVPQYLWWRVTRYCNRRCKYCCVAAQHFRQAKDATLSYQRLDELLHEGADIGVRGVALGGGEPFIRPDMVELVELMLRLGYEVGINTKFALSERQIARLAQAGLPDINVSFDSPEPATANYLVGDARFYDEITRTMRSLVAHGVKLMVTSVLTEMNARQLPELAVFLAELGVFELTLNTFSRYYGRCRYVRRFELQPDTRAWLRDTLPRLEQHYAGRMAFVPDRFFCLGDAVAGAGDGLARGAVDARPPEKKLHCDQGIRVLRILPDGRASRCDQWWYEEEVVCGDLRTQSLYEVWSSPQMLAMIYPERARFAGTACHNCGQFDACSATGRCIFAAHETHGSVYAPDNHCFRQVAS